MFTILYWTTHSCLTNHLTSPFLLEEIVNYSSKVIKRRGCMVLNIIGQSYGVHKNLDFPTNSSRVSSFFKSAKIEL